MGRQKKNNNRQAAQINMQANRPTIQDMLVEEWGGNPPQPGDIVAYFEDKRIEHLENNLRKKILHPCPSHFAVVSHIDAKGNIWITHQQSGVADDKQRSKHDLYSDDGIHTSRLTPASKTRWYTWYRLQENTTSTIQIPKLIKQTLALLKQWQEWHFAFDATAAIERGKHAADPVMDNEALANDLFNNMWFLYRCAARNELHDLPRQPRHGASCILLAILAYQIAELQLNGAIHPADTVRDMLNNRWSPTTLFGDNGNNGTNNHTTSTQRKMHVSDCHASHALTEAVISDLNNTGHPLASSYQADQERYQNRERRDESDTVPSLLFVKPNAKLPTFMTVDARTVTPQSLYAYLNGAEGRAASPWRKVAEKQNPNHTHNRKDDDPSTKCTKQDKSATKRSCDLQEAIGRPVSMK